MIPRRRAGFTLLELLLALSIAAVVAAGVYGVVRGGVDAQRAGEDATRTLQIARVALCRIASSLRCAFVSQGKLRGAFVGEDESDGDSDLDSLSFVADNHEPREDENGECDLVKLEYYIDTDESTDERGLVESASSVVVSDEDAEPDVIEIAPEIRSLNFRYYDGEEWQDEWDSTTSVVLPRGVEIVIAVAVHEDDEASQWKRFKMVVALPAAGAVTKKDLADAQAQTAP